MKVLLIIATLLSVTLADKYKPTSSVYPPDADKDKICRLYFGVGAKPADFEDLQAMSTEQVVLAMEYAGIQKAVHIEKYFININGQSLFAGSHMHAYFFEYHGGPPPAFFDAIETHGGVSVGITNKFGHVLCTVPDTQVRRHLEHVEAVQVEPMVSKMMNTEKVQVKAPKKKGWFGWRKQ